MNRKYLIHFISVALKQFFDLDARLIGQSLVVFSVLLFACKAILHGVGNYFYDGWLTVKEDAAFLHGRAMTIKEQWEDSYAHELISSYTNELRENLLERVRVFNN